MRQDAGSPRDAAPPSPAASGSGAVDRSLLLVIGCSRSGTTLLSEALSQHPDVFISPESKFFQWIWSERLLARVLPARLRREIALTAIREAEYPREEALFPDHLAALRAGLESADSLESAFCSFMFDLSERRIVGEKTPWHTPLVSVLLPRLPARTKVLAICRQAPAVVASSLANARLRRTSTVEQCLARWVYMNQRVLQLRRTLPADRFRLLRFEDLIEDPQHEMSALCEWLGVPFDDAMLSPGRQRSSLVGSRSRAPGSAFDGEALTRWRSQLDERQVRMIEGYAAPVSRRLGYDAPRRPVAATTRARMAGALSVYHLGGALMAAGVYPLGATPRAVARALGSGRRS